MSRRREKEHVRISCLVELEDVLNIKDSSQDCPAGDCMILHEQLKRLWSVLLGL